MASELSLQHNATGETLYAILRDTVGQVCTVASGTFGAYATASLGDYDIAMTEQGTASRYYSGDMPANVAAGTYYACVFKQAGGAPAEGDSLVGSGEIGWDGSAVVGAAAIKAKTDLIPASPAAVGSAMTLANDAVNAAAISADAVAEILDTADTIETGLTLRGVLRLMGAALAGKLSGANTNTETFRNVGDTKDRITATVDAAGNRTAITTDTT